MELELKEKESQLEKSTNLLKEKEDKYEKEILETNTKNKKLELEITDIKQSNETQKIEINARKQLLIQENEKIITENANLKTDLEKMKNGFQDLVSMYKKEKAENSKKTKQIDELKKLLIKPTGGVRQSPYGTPSSVKQSPFTSASVKSQQLPFTNKTNQ